MKKNFVKLTLLFFAIIFGIVCFLLLGRKIWFIYPDKNIYSVDGLDISHHQGRINWEKVDRKYRFVFIKATEGDTFIDKRFYENVYDIKNTNRILGAYHFFHFNYNGIEQAENFIRVAGNNIDLPPVVDFEFTGNPGKFDKIKILKELNNCINTIEEHYKHKVIIYTTHDAYKYIIKDNFNNPIWCRSVIFPINKNIKNVLFWQYHNSAIIDGIDTKVDLNVFKGNLAGLKEMIMK
ncbi:MAG: hypothetical protein LBJ31_06310 [Treponema sp.]|nr:hypothetical protein [Treponema sp.]